MIENRADELDRFKRDIDLRALAASMGYRLDKAKSSRNCAVMTDAKGDKVAVTRQPNGHWTYFSVRDDGDNGTVIDFLQRRTGKSLGDVRKALRAWAGTAGECSAMPSFAPVSRDEAGMLREWIATRPLGCHPFLEARGLGAALADPRFTGTIHEDARGNAVFPHHDGEGNVTGFERRNHGFKGFSAGGTKTMWMSNARPKDTRLVICESPLDCMAYHLLKGDERTRYLATGGALSKTQLAAICAAVDGMPGLVVVIATDNDEGGETLARQIADTLSREADRDVPPGKDWNAVLMGSARFGHAQHRRI